MDFRDNTADDSHVLHGGCIPGAEGAPAFTLKSAQVSAIPVLIAVPHAGRAYPPALLDRMRNPDFATLRLEDRLVDCLGTAVARETGASLLVAQAPRAMIDLNRAEDDVDWDMFGRSAPDSDSCYTPNARARSGLGLIPRRLPGLGEVWKGRHDPADLEARIAGIHQPYHACLAQQLDDIRQRWGAALLIDLHSMPPLPPSGGQPGASFVLGDRFGSTCDGGVVASAFACLAQRGARMAHNRPYAGGYVLDRHAAPNRGIHALQLEVDRSCYLDSRLVDPGEGFAAMLALLAALVRQLASDVAVLGRFGAAAPWQAAAE